MTAYFIEMQGGNVVHKEISSNDYFSMLKKLLAGSKEIDAVVLLAMDGIYDPIGSVQHDAVLTELMVSNQKEKISLRGFCQSQ